MRQGLASLVCLTSLFIGVAGMRADAQTTALVARTAVDQVDVIAPDKTQSLMVGTAPSDIAISQDGTSAYVTNSGANSVSVIDLSTPAAIVSEFAVGDHPTSIVVTPGNDHLYVMTSAGVEMVDLQGGSRTPLDVVTSGRGQLAITRDGQYVFVASGNVTVIDAKDNNKVVGVFGPEKAPAAGISNVAVGVAIAPDDAHAFVSVVSYISDSFSFRVSGGLAIIDRALLGTPNSPVSSTVDLFSQPGSIAFTNDGDRAYVAIESYWADTLYGAGFLPGRWVALIDNSAEVPALSKWIDLGAGGAASPTPAGLAMAPDRSALFVSVPKTDSVLVIDPATDLLKDPPILVAGSPNSVAVVPNPAAKPVAFTPHATDDIAPTPFPALHAAMAIANVLANDTIGGAQAAIGNVTLSVDAAHSSASLTLDVDTGAVWVAANAVAGVQTLTYQICDPANPGVCAVGLVTVPVRDRYAISTTDDIATALPGTVAIANILANDRLGPDAASPGTVTPFIASPDAGLALNADGSIVVAASAAKGVHVLTYRIRENADPTNVSDTIGSVRVDVVWRDIQATGEGASASRAGGVAIANVLANDAFDGLPATLARVRIETAASSSGVTLDPTTGSVSVAPGTALGQKTLTYHICEEANPANCSSDVSVAITVTSYVVNAVADSARASSKTGGTAVVNVLANDSFGDSPATVANVKVSLVSLSPSNKQI